jgi:hypothetical protein
VVESRRTHDKKLVLLGGVGGAGPMGGGGGGGGEGQFSRLLAGELCTSACRVCSARASLCSVVM